MRVALYIPSYTKKGDIGTFIIWSRYLGQPGQKIKVDRAPRGLTPRPEVAKPLAMRKGTRRTTQLALWTGKAVSSRATNQQCANIILSNMQRYGGTGSLMVQWAVMVRDGYEKTQQHWRLSA